VSAIASGAAPGIESAPPRQGLPPRSRPYFVSVVAAATIVSLPLLARLTPHTRGWLTFGLLLGAAGLTQYFVVHTPQNQVFHMAIVFVVAAALLLPPELVVLLCIAQHLSDWLKERYCWYIQTFNICNYVLAALAGLAAGRLVAGVQPTAGGLRIVLGGFAASVTFVLLNHVVLAPMLCLARGHGPRETGLFSFDAVSTDLVLALLGVGVAVFWRTEPAALPIALAPLILIHRALAVPQLQVQARVDAKTGLFNARHLGTQLEEELARAARFERPLSLLMADLDLLREINNRHGHLVGDAVLQGVAAVFRSELRPYDVPARFGGEEFVVVLPETTAEQAGEIAERIRAAVAERTYRAKPSTEPVQATLSIGVASFPRHASDSQELLHQADLAVYRAKLDGRNRVHEALCSTEVPGSSRG
jgi:diguanylate cyclase (GGDEF)-like protein